MSILGYLGNISLAFAALFCVISLFKQGYAELAKNIFVFAAFAILVAAFIWNDFSIVSVEQNSHTLQPFIYRIAATWSHHEGSMLLWIAVMQFYSIAFSCFSKFDTDIKNAVIKINNIISAPFLLYIIFLSSPFGTSSMAGEGFGLNPILQDSFVLIHPPKLYLGYVGTAILFAITLGVLMKGDLRNKSTFFLLDPWITIAWMMLTGGVILGGNWAYRELGWGGFWSWDPVENISIIPWILLTIAFHANQMAKRDVYYFVKPTIISLLLTFITATAGTTLVRSGQLNSLHSFSQDLSRGFAMSLIVIMIIAIAMTVLIRSWKKIPADNIDTATILTSKGIVYILTIILYTILFFITFGTVAPLFIKNMSSIDSGYFNNTISIPAIICLLLAGFASIINDKLKKRKNITYATTMFIFLALCLYFKYQSLISNASFVSLCIIASCLSCISMLFASIFTNIKKSFFIMFWSHLGFAMVALGLVMPMALGIEEDMSFSDKKPQSSIYEYNLKMSDIKYNYAKNYITRIIGIDIYHKDRFIEKAKPETRFYPAQDFFSSEVYSVTNNIDDIYIAVTGIKNQENQKHKTIYIHVAYRPGIKLLWLGSFIMVIGIFLHWVSLVFRKHD